MRRILCLDLPNWPIQRLLAERRDTPLLLHARDPRRGELVVACNTAARERGVRWMMPLAEAAALAQHGGECSILPHDPAADLAALARLAEHCERFSPLVGWETVESPGPDCLFLDITSIGVLFGDEEILAREVIADLARLGYEARVAVADTIGAALAGAKYGVQGSGYHRQSDGRGAQDSGDQVLSTGYLVLSTCSRIKPASDPRLPTLPIESLRLPQETVALLAQLGIVRIEQLLELPRESLRARFGEQLLLRLDQLLGTAQETIVPYRPPPQFVEEWLLEYPAERREVVEQIVQELVQRVAQALANRREGVVQLVCRLDCDPGRPLLLEVGLFRPSADAEHLRDLLRMQLEQASLPGPVGRVRLEATFTARLENRQGELFAGDEHEAQRQLALFIDRCSSRLGPEAVLCPELTADSLPERRVKYRVGIRRRGLGVRKRGSGFRVQGSASSEVRKSRGAAKYSVLRTQYAVHSTQSRQSHPSLDFQLPTPDPRFRPLFLYSPPLALDVLSVAPDGPPVSFRFQGRTHRVADRSGPERIETGWWRGKSVRRDYWRIATTSGQRFWLFRDLAEGKWHLHGEYA